MKTLVVIPTPEEFDFFSSGCQRRGFRAENSVIGRLPVVEFPALNLTAARGGAGKANFAVHTQHLLDARPDWEVVVCAGAAGGLVDDLSVGDVVVATTTVEHDYNNKFTVRPLPRFDGSLPGIAELRQMPLSAYSFKVEFGVVASGDEDIVEVERRKSLREATGALAVAWEGAGGARACAFSQVPFIEIRGLTDAADHTAASDFEKNLELALGNVATLITTWVEA
jgi:adenosylhomocysteine nucleosidase